MYFFHQLLFLRGNLPGLTGGMIISAKARIVAGYVTVNACNRTDFRYTY